MTLEQKKKPKYVCNIKYYATYNKQNCTWKKRQWINLHLISFPITLRHYYSAWSLSYLKIQPSSNKNSKTSFINHLRLQFWNNLLQLTTVILAKWKQIHNFKQKSNSALLIKQLHLQDLSTPASNTSRIEGKKRLRKILTRKTF